MVPSFLTKMVNEDANAASEMCSNGNDTSFDFAICCCHTIMSLPMPRENMQASSWGR